MNTAADDHSIHQQIDQLSDVELRGVIKYLVLLNAEAVQNALNYTVQHRPKNNTATNAANTTNNKGVEDSFEAEFTSEFDEAAAKIAEKEAEIEIDTDTTEDVVDPAAPLVLDDNIDDDDADMPPLLQKSRRSQSEEEGLDDAALPPPQAAPSSPNKVMMQQTPQKVDSQTSSSSDANSTDSSSVVTARISNSTNSSSSSSNSVVTAPTSNTNTNTSSRNNKSSRRLMVLCSMKPATNQEAIDQDDAMVFCKHIGILPYIILAESRPEKTLELTSISKIPNAYPQFFLTESSSGHHIEYVGSLDLMRQMKKDGTLTCPQDLLQIPMFTRQPLEQQQQQQQHSTPAPKKQLTFDDKEDEILGEGSPFSAIPEHLQSKRDHDRQQQQRQQQKQRQQYPPASNLYQHLLHLAQPNTAKPDSEADEDGDIGPLEPPEGGHVVLQAKNGNRREEPPARSPPQSAKKAAARASPAPPHAHGEENNKGELSTTEPPRYSNHHPPPPATPNAKAQVVNTSEPPALSPPKTTTKAQRRVLQEETDGHVPSTPNAQVVKQYHQDGNAKPEPTPGGNQILRKEAVPLEPPSAHKEVHVHATAAGTAVVVPPPQEVTLPFPPPSVHVEDSSHGKYLPESPTTTAAVVAPPPLPFVMEALQQQQQQQQQQDDSLNVTPEIPGYAEHQQDLVNATATTAAEQQTSSAPPLSPADDQVLSILHGVGACYLVYDEREEAGKLNIYYSETPMDHAVGVWSSTDITDFKESQGLGSKEFIGNCATACQTSPSNYFKGWSQFIKAAKSMNGTVITLTKYGMPVDFYTYCNNGGDAIAEKVPGIQFETNGLDAIACLPKGANFDYQTLRARKWSKQAKKLGSVATFNSLVHNAGSPSKAPVAASASIASNPPPASTVEAAQVNPKPFVSSQPMMEDVASLPVRQPKDGYPSSLETPNPEGGACYLVYESDSSGKLVEHFSHTPIEGAVGMWVPGPGKKIAGFKFKRNHGKSELIGNCSAGMQGRKNYCSGWNQFVRSAKIQNGEVMRWDPLEGAKGMAVDVWLYTNDKRPGHQSIKLETGVSTNVEHILAISTIPKNTSFFEGISVDMLKWLAEGGKNGASSKFE